MTQRLCAPPIEDYAIIGDCQTAALVSRGGSIDWLCLPRFDSAACFAALLGGPEHGRWLVAPAGEPKSIERAYREGTLVLDTTFHADGGTVTLTDCMPIRERVPHLVRVVHGVRGRVRMRTQLIVRFDYGSIVPWVRKVGDDLVAIAGPDSLHIRSDVPLRGEGLTTVGEFDVAEGQTVALSLTWQPSHLPAPPAIDAASVVVEAERRWRKWAAQCTYAGARRDIVVRSLVTLAALTHTATGGIVAAPTTSLPGSLRRCEKLGLSLLLVARRDLHPSGAGEQRFSPRGPRMAGVAIARSGRRSFEVANPVRSRRRATDR